MRTKIIILKLLLSLKKSVINYFFLQKNIFANDAFLHNIDEY